MQQRETKWTPMKALGKASQKIEELGIPIFDPQLLQDENLNFGDIASYDDEKIASLLVIYGGYKASLETKVADIEASHGALEAAFNEGYSTALFMIVKGYEEEDKKKPTRDELRGEIMSKYDTLRDLKREIIEQEIELKRLQGLLNTYTSAYNAVSRVVTLRTKGADKL
jgi:hypothetical protein|tara:strand:- start:245 stop:751 length:507 start_codon:yes stop_codon:yes gene_type:complete